MISIDLAQVAPAAGGDPILTLVNLGIAGVIIIGMLTGRIWPQPGVRKLEEQVERERARAERAEAQRDALIATYEDRVLPVLAEGSAAAKRMSDVADQMLRRLDRDRP